jgi:hypothetical protein
MFGQLPSGKTLHEAKTQIIRVADAGSRRRRDTVPEPVPSAGSDSLRSPGVPPAKAHKPPADDFDENEETSLPLNDDDLEPA